jgi:SagB-type dehydrogenase family enzyme
MFLLKNSHDCHYVINEKTIQVQLGHFEYSISKIDVPEICLLFIEGLEITEESLCSLMGTIKNKSYLNFFISNRLLDVSYVEEGEELFRFKAFELSEILDQLKFFMNKDLHYDNYLEQIDQYYFRVDDDCVKVETTLFKLCIHIPVKYFYLKSRAFFINGNKPVSGMLLSYLNYKYKSDYPAVDNFFMCSFEDMLFDKSSCQGRTSGLVGGYFKQKVLRKNMKEVEIAKDLSLNDFEYRIDSNPIKNDFFKLQLNRQSCRQFEVEELPISELNKLCQRICVSWKGVYGEEHKLYPSGGAIHECEYFIVPMMVEGLEHGVYWLDQNQKVLKGVEVDPVLLDEFVSKTPPYSWKSHPHFYIYLACDVSKRSFKYEGIALKNSLLNTGVIVEFLTLNCCDLELDSCPLGGGNGELFLKLLGLNPWALYLTGSIGIGKKKIT